VNQLQTYLNDNHLHAQMQSAYRPHHSTETALVKVQSDILTALDQHKEAMLVLLDFSAAFDLLDHQQLLARLSSRYGIGGIALQWFASYLQGRTQSVSIKDIMSEPVNLQCGVPQGSVAGPLAFIIFSAPLLDIIAAHGISVMVYADDTQLYISFAPGDRDIAVKKLEACIADIRAWCKQNNLALNDSKTELIFIQSRFSKDNCSPSIKIGNAVIRPSQKARNLGVIMDSTISMSHQVNQVCKTAMHAIRKIGQIRQYLDQAATTRLVHAFVTSRLDCCNSLLYGLTNKELDKIQRVQNVAARLVARTPRRSHITPVLKTLHWLPIRQRIAYKILLLIYKSLHGLAPKYIADLIDVNAPSIILRSGYRLPNVWPKMKTHGVRSLPFAATYLWSSIPVALRHSPTVAIFKSKLKTHLFTMYFGTS